MTTINTNNDLSDLLACPFCGGKPEVIFKGNKHTAKRAVTIKCTQCRCQRTNAGIISPLTTLARVAIEQWNARAGQVNNSPTWPHVLAFANRMEAKLVKNRHKGDREGWLKDDPWSLVERVLDETVEVQQCFTQGSDGRIDFKDAEELADECADVANFCMMVADCAADQDQVKSTNTKPNENKHTTVL